MRALAQLDKYHYAKRYVNTRLFACSQLIITKRQQHLPPHHHLIFFLLVVLKEANFLHAHHQRTSYHNWIRRS